MIIIQIPLRISFLGGGTDFKDFYMDHSGAVLSTTIDKYVYVIVKERFDDLICLNYSKREKVKRLEKLRHELLREALRITGIHKGIEITTLADIPGEGTGLGSSSSTTVGALHALYSYKGELITAESLAQAACHIEIDILGKPIGKQDQYIAAYGALSFITFENKEVKVNKIEISPQDAERLDDRLLLFHTNIIRNSNDILSEQKANINQHLMVLHEMRKLAFEARDAILNGTHDDFGEILHHGWVLKKRLASGVSNSRINGIYEIARRAGAIGGKITGAGGGGFLLLYCPKERQDEVRMALKGLREIPFHFEQQGSKVIFNDRRSNRNLYY